MWKATLSPPNRSPAKWYQAINPVWWLSDVERNMNWPWWKWALRNILANFNAVIIGVQHKERLWCCEDGFVNFKHGFLIAYTFVTGSWWPRWYFSYRGSYIEIAHGWKTHGGFSTITFRRASSPNAGEYP